MQKKGRTIFVVSIPPPSALVDLLRTTDSDAAHVNSHFRDPNYSADSRLLHPSERRTRRDGERNINARLSHVPHRPRSQSKLNRYSLPPSFLL